MSMDLEKIKKQLLADKKKLSILVTLCAVGLLMWGRLLMTDVPRTAVAKPRKATGSAASSSGASSARPTSATIRQMPEVEANLVARVERDVFAFNRGLYPQAEVKEKPKEVTAVQQYVPDPADKAKAMEKLIRAEAAKLSLQSTVLGARPRAMINGTLLATGETIQGFEVVEIRSRSVSVRKDHVTVDLDM